MQPVGAEQARSTPSPERTLSTPNHWMLLNSWSCSRAQSSGTHVQHLPTHATCGTIIVLSRLSCFYDHGKRQSKSDWLRSPTFKAHWGSTNVLETRAVVERTDASSYHSFSPSFFCHSGFQYLRKCTGWFDIVCTCSLGEVAPSMQRSLRLTQNLPEHGTTAAAHRSLRGCVKCVEQISHAQVCDNRWDFNL